MTAATERVRSAFVARVRRRADRGLVGSRPGQPDRRAHGLQRRVRAARSRCPSRTAVAASPLVIQSGRCGRSRRGRWSSFGASDLVPGSVTGWAAYAAGVVWSLREAGVDVPPARLAHHLGCAASAPACPRRPRWSAPCSRRCWTSPVPRFRCWSWPGVARRAENGYVGVPCGIMDQTAATSVPRRPRAVPGLSKSRDRSRYRSTWRRPGWPW